MALITSPGSNDATSFASVAEADAAIAKYYPDDTVWTALDTSMKELCLEGAAIFIEEYFCFSGYRAFKYQRLCFPRKECQERIGYTLMAVPEPVKEAQALIARDVIYKNLLGRPAADEDSSGLEITSLSVGGLSLSVSGDVGLGNPIEAFIRNSHGSISLLLGKFTAFIRGGVLNSRVYLSTTTTTSTSSTSSTSTTSTTSTTTTTTA